MDNKKKKSKLPIHIKIANTFQNSAAVGANGELYMWGSPTSGFIPNKLLAA